MSQTQNSEWNETPFISTEKESCPGCGSDTFHLTFSNTPRIECAECNHSIHVWDLCPDDRH